MVFMITLPIFAMEMSNPFGQGLKASSSFCYCAYILRILGLVRDIQVSY